ncbi:hypothetical protein V2S66_19610 [Streptomyces sp. V4-01]|uniref:Uncharacterized protein n=1 Tax=Actinacidiphila polyblastidii TaxID=3110430 RepID=A0ABU7PED8_9ACTN|nr:hypothetical protein [Streptomyces sp. V4-01]
MNTMNGGDSRPPQQGPGVHQSSGPGGDVGVQQAVGANHGQVTQIGGDQYVVHPDATPEERYAMGLRLLEAGLRVRAEELISEAVAHGLDTPEVLYYWALSIVSRRAVQDVASPEDMERLRAVERLAGDLGRDPFGQALRVVMTMLDEAFGRPSDADPADELSSRRGGTAETAAAALTEDRQRELRDHLRHFGTEIARERGAAAERQDIEEHRLDGRRRERVPLFFEPEPLPPVRVQQVGVVLKRRFKAMAVAGGLLLLAGLVEGVPAAFRGSVGTALVGLLLCAAGGAGALRFGPDRAWLRQRAKVEDFWREHGGPISRRHVPFLPEWDPGVPAGPQAEFAAAVGQIVTDHFAAQPRQNEDRNAWWAASAVTRDDLTLTLTDTYGPDADPYGLDWLVRGYAREAARLWREGGLGNGPRSRVSLAMHAGWFGGLLLLAIGVLAVGSAAGGQDAGATALAAVLCAGGGWLGAKGAVPFRHEHLRRTVDREEIDAHAAGERGAYDEWRAFLDAEQPKDWEMGRWLNYDTRWLRGEALAQYDLRPQQVVYDFFVLEAGDDARRARVFNGPMRYSVYRVRLYVMTERGIRLATWTLDFAEGTHHGRSDTSQRYESISSVKVDRASIQLTDRRSGHRETVTVLPDGSIRGNPEQGELMLSEELVIERDSSHETRLKVENFTTIRHHAYEDLRHLLQLSQEASGISTASRILVAVAAEGREWFDEQRQRNSRRFAESKERPAGDAQVKQLVPRQPGAPAGGSAAGSGGGTAQEGPAAGA